MTQKRLLKRNKITSTTEGTFRRENVDKNGLLAVPREQMYSEEKERPGTQLCSATHKIQTADCQNSYKRLT